MISSIRAGVFNAYDRLWIISKEKRDKSKLSIDKYQSIIQKYPLSLEQKRSVDDLYMRTLGHRIPYEWHQFYAAHAGVFTPEFFPDYLLHARFEHYMNYNVHYAYVFEDKNVLPYIAQIAGVKMPKTILSSTCGALRNQNNVIVDSKQAISILRSCGIVFCKPSTISCGGRGCSIVDFSTYHDDNEIWACLSKMGQDFVIQELIRCHSSINALYPKAVNTFRIITYRWREGFFHMPVFMRIGQGGAVVDNGASGGLFVGVRDNGELTDKAVTLEDISILSHPDTKMFFNGYRIPGFESVISAALKMHTMIPEIGIVYWDFTLDVNGTPVLIECNIINGTVYALQMTHGVGPFGTHTPEVLSWIRTMNHVPYFKRHFYSFGKQ